MACNLLFVMAAAVSDTDLREVPTNHAGWPRGLKSYLSPPTLTGTGGAHRHLIACCDVYSCKHHWITKKSWCNAHAVSYQTLFPSALQAATQHTNAP